MATPRIELIPLRHAVRLDASTQLDLLVKIVPPPLDPSSLKRPHLNLGLVLDRSGSMAEDSKMSFCHQAASYVVDQLLPTDQVSITVFDTQVDLLVPTTPAWNKPALHRAIGKALPRGGTDLHAGWSCGAAAARRYPEQAGLNRVLLLTDGNANQGITDPVRIARDVARSLGQGVGTSTFGMGIDYNEHLLEAMANAGDGNYYYIESPAQLPAIFEAELRGIVATVGTRVSLGFEPAPDVRVVEVLNDLPTTEYGRTKLPNLVMGNPLHVVVRLEVSPRTSTADLCKVRLAWNTGQDDSTRRSLEESIALAAVSSEGYESLAEQPEVVEQVAFLMAARAKREAVEAAMRNDFAGTQAAHFRARAFISGLASSPAVLEEDLEIEAVENKLSPDNLNEFIKLAHMQRYRRSSGRSPVNQAPPQENPPAE